MTPKRRSPTVTERRRSRCRRPRCGSKCYRSGETMDVPGGLEEVIIRGNRSLYVVTIIAKYAYEETAESQALKRIIVSCIPNGLLQERYNPDAFNGIWLAGRNAPSRGEDFRVRLNYRNLASKAEWRVQEIRPRRVGKHRAAQEERPRQTSQVHHAGADRRIARRD